MLDVLVGLGRWGSIVVICGLCAAFAAIGLVPCWYGYHAIQAAFGDFAAFLSTPFLYFVWGTTYCACCILLKMALFYHPKEGSWPLFNWRSIGWGLTGATINFGAIFFLRVLKGTPALNLFFRLLGAKIGRRVSINTVEIYDWNLLTIGDDVVLGGDCCLMAHSVEGGTMFMRPIVIEDKAMVGGNAKVMPGCVIEAGAVLGASSLLTKGEHIPAHQMWGGMPARFIKDRSKAKVAAQEPAPTTSPTAG